MTTIKGHDGEQYVLVLTKEEAEVLGTFRYNHVSGASPMFEILRGLPNREGCKFSTRDGDAPVFLELVPPKTRFNAGPATFGFGTPGGFRNDDIVEPLKFLCTIPSIDNLPKAAPKPKWIVQFNKNSFCTDGVASDWGRVTGSKPTATGEYESRNEAYRQMKRRAGTIGTAVSWYRVVPSITPDGPEKDRGYYIVQYHTWAGKWEDTHMGPGHGNNCGPGGRYFTAEAAERDIKEFGSKEDTYRVKWYPYNK